jgi:Replication-relaxation
MKLLDRYYYLRARQIQRRLLPHDDDCAITRSRLRKLVEFGWVRKHAPKMVDPFSTNNSSSPVYTITTGGASMLAVETGDSSYLIANEPNFSQWLSLNHYCALSALHMIIDDAFVGKDFVRMTKLYFEHEVINPDATDGSKYRLHTTLSKPGEKQLFCCPDSAFETEILDETKRAWFVEYETGSDAPKRVFAKKHRGAAKFAADKCWTRIFPEAADCRILCFCPNAAWRDALRKEFIGKPGEDVWRFCATPDVKPETFLHGAIMYTAKEGPLAIFPR